MQMIALCMPTIKNQKLLFVIYDNNFLYYLIGFMTLYGADSRKVSLLYGVKENEQLDLICSGITLKPSSHQRILVVIFGNKFSFDEHIINICKTANNKLTALSRINHYIKQNQKEILLPSFIISHSSYCPLIWSFYSKKSTKNKYCS